MVREAETLQRLLRDVRGRERGRERRSQRLPGADVSGVLADDFRQEGDELLLAAADEVFRGAEVPEEGALGDAGFAGDLPDGGLLVPPSRKTPFLLAWGGRWSVNGRPGPAAGAGRSCGSCFAGLYLLRSHTSPGWGPTTGGRSRDVGGDHLRGHIGLYLATTPVGLRPGVAHGPPALRTVEPCPRLGQAAPRNPRRTRRAR